ncbi:GAF and ANTAR domain-containing protein [Kribbella deserti]|uniref:GAF and ANTAR domain-containing protein n=1 Tax=Kribbella deserti TaxID=1926257 RepID=A0ABV6QIV3_9ACTN
MTEDFAAELARMALELHDQPDVDQTAQRVLDFVPRTIGCDQAGIVLANRGRLRAVAASGPESAAVDQYQVRVGDGPATVAVEQSASVRVDDTEADGQWPAWSRLAAAHGLRSALSVRLYTLGSTIGALTLYDAKPSRFGPEQEAVAHVLAHHASVALSSARNEETLWEAIDARKEIGQAQGMLMERFALSADQSFDVLRRYSQAHNVKLREVAQRLISTRRLPG